jgi:CRP-like cAMP-binding protein
MFRALERPAGCDVSIHMQSLITRISGYAPLSDEEFASLRAASVERVRKARGAPLVASGEPLSHVFVISKGWAIRYRTLPDKRRQIVNVMLPGDCFDLQALIAAKADHGVDALTNVELLRMRSEDFLQAISASARLATAFWWAAVQEESILREQIVRLGRRSGRERLAHMLLELRRRLLHAGVDVGDQLSLPMSREVLADLLGLSSVHVSRSSAALRNAGLIRTSNGAIQLLDIDGLVQVGQFDPSYLHATQHLSV